MLADPHDDLLSMSARRFHLTFTALIIILMCALAFGTSHERPTSLGYILFGVFAAGMLWLSREF